MLKVAIDNFQLLYRTALKLDSNPLTSTTQLNSTTTIANSTQHSECAHSSLNTSLVTAAECVQQVQHKAVQFMQFKHFFTVSVAQTHLQLSQ